VAYDTSVIEQRRFNTDQLDRYKADKDFDYEVKKRKPTLLERVLNWFKRILFNFLSWLFGNKAATGILAFIIQAIL